MTALEDLVGTKWSGKAELWEDPMGDQAQVSDCELFVEDGRLRYTWSYQGKPHEGTVSLTEAGADFQDSWHQSEPMVCTIVPGGTSLLRVQGTYSGDWGWRVNLCFREPTGQLVLQMTNIAPWGEEARLELPRAKSSRDPLVTGCLRRPWIGPTRPRQSQPRHDDGDETAKECGSRIDCSPNIGGVPKGQPAVGARWDRVERTIGDVRLDHHGIDLLELELELTDVNDGADDHVHAD